MAVEDNRGRVSSRETGVYDNHKATLDSEGVINCVSREKGVIGLMLRED